ncbi:glycosyltransferase family 4 protein [candidate division WOR-3 bacterium]|nr:glycosyltransferase family 4 protein [candidate division WOR-3 bacterium]
MKICYLTHNYPRYDGDYSGLPFKHITHALAEKDYQFTIITPHAENLPEYEKRKNVEIIRFRYSTRESIAYTGKMQKFFKNPLYWNEFFSFFKKFYFSSRNAGNIFDLLHCHWMIPAGLIGKIIPCRKKLLSLHGSDVRFTSYYKLDRFAEYLFSDYDLILPVSKFLEETARKWVDKQKLVTAPFITNIDNFIYKPADNFMKPLRLLTVSRLSKQKNLSVPIEAVKRLVDEGYKLTYTIIGDGEEKESLLNQVKNLDLTAIVEFKGLINHREIPRLMKDYSVCLIPSFDEGFGISVIEARLAGRLVIGSDSGNVKYIIKDGKTGIKFNPYSAEDLVRKIKTVFNDPKRAIKIAQDSNTEAVKLYKFENQINTWNNIYSKFK